MDRMDWYVLGGSNYVLICPSAEEVEVTVEETVTVLA
jgi:hypothetical protein